MGSFFYFASYYLLLLPQNNMFYDVAKIDVGRMCPISHEDSGTDPAVHQFKVRIVFSNHTQHHIANATPSTSKKGNYNWTTGE